jgi:hypothetical protein
MNDDADAHAISWPLNVSSYLEFFLFFWTRKGSEWPGIKGFVVQKVQELIEITTRTSTFAPTTLKQI